jgi:hypothetical protein
MSKTAETKWREYSASARLNFILFMVMFGMLVVVAVPIAVECYSTVVAAADVLSGPYPLTNP